MRVQENISEKYFSELDGYLHLECEREGSVNYGGKELLIKVEIKKE